MVIDLINFSEGLINLPVYKTVSRECWCLSLSLYSTAMRKPLTLGSCVGLYPQQDNFALSLPTCWYSKSLADPERPPMPASNAQRRPITPNSSPNASQWNMVRIGDVRVGFALGIYISRCLCRFCSHCVRNAKVLSDGIWALLYRVDVETDSLFYGINK